MAATDNLGEQMKVSFKRQGEGRKAPSDPTFHPSRDEPHFIGDETKEGQGVLLDQGESPTRLTMFGAQGGRNAQDEYEEPVNLSRLRPVPGDPRAQGIEAELVDIGRHSSVPVAHWQGSRSPIDVTSEGTTADAGGFYQHGKPGDTPLIAVRSPGLRSDATETLLHEMGHARHYEEITQKSKRDNPTKKYRDERGYSPDPLKEAIADAYVDRYGGSESAHRKIAESHRKAVDFATEHDIPAVEEPKPFSHISDEQFGYSSQYEIKYGAGAAWDDPDRTVYAGVRAHYGETGEMARYQQAPGSTRYSHIGSGTNAAATNAAADATIAMLHQHSEHARAAWENLTIGSESGPKRAMTDVANEAIRRHKDRRLLSQGQEIQESLFGEPELARNQFGERPRTIAEVRNTVVNEGHLHDFTKLEP